MTQDYNSIVAASLMHTVTFPKTFYNFYYRGKYDEMVDFKSLDEEGTIYNLKQGTVYHYWGTNTEYDLETLLVQAMVDLLTLVLTPYIIFTIPCQYVFRAIKWMLYTIAFAQYRSFVRDWYTGDYFDEKEVESKDDRDN